MPSQSAVAVGLDFGTESVRALLVDLRGRERASAVVAYEHGQITRKLPATGKRLPPHFALQHPHDWLTASGKAVRRALKEGRVDPADVVSLGVDFTSCTMLPCRADGAPLCLDKKWASEKYAWPKLWKHHGAVEETARMNAVARRRKEKWLARYGGTIGLEWFFPKILETQVHAPAVYRAADVWIEAGDWYVWQLVGGPAKQLPRSTCQAGYKALWNARSGYPSPKFFKALHPALEHVVRDKLPGRLIAPGQSAGELCKPLAKRLGLRPGIAVSAAAIDAHAGVPGAGVAEAGTLVMVLGTSSCHMLNARVEKLVPGIAGVVRDGILPGYYGYETGQAAVGDAFDWMRRLAGRNGFRKLNRAAGKLPPGAEGVRCLDWLAGCRTPLMDGALRGAFAGLALHHGPEHLYRALIEATACGVRWIVELLEGGGVPVRKLVATGGLPHHNPLLVQIYADVLGKPIAVPSTQHGPALGAAMLGVLAAGRKATGFASATAAIRTLASGGAKKGGGDALVYRPNRSHGQTYDAIYGDYRQLAKQFS